MQFSHDTASVRRMDEEVIPSYEEAAKSTHLASAASSSTPIGVQIANVQRERVYATANANIQAFLHSHIQAGLSKMVYVLIPSDSDPLSVIDQSLLSTTLEKGRSSRRDYLTQHPLEEIANFEDDDHVRAVRLQGPENAARFWQQPSVIKILRRAICEMVNVDEYRPALEHVVPAKDLQMMSKRERRDYEAAKSVGTLGRGIGWRSGATSSSPKQGETTVDVEVGELSIRRATEIGLYETRTTSAVVVRVHIGS